MSRAVLLGLSDWVEREARKKGKGIDIEVCISSGRRGRIQAIARNEQSFL